MSNEPLRLIVVRYVLPATYSVLPARCRSYKATALLVAIGLQESGLAHRQQYGGSARGLWQFETTGVRGVLTHPRTSDLALAALAALGYLPPIETAAIHQALEDNDILAAVLARLLLWTDAEPLPPEDDPDAGWAIYQRTWRPGLPRAESWRGCYAAGWAALELSC